jgi:hypothetical protein
LPGIALVFSNSYLPAIKKIYKFSYNHQKTISVPHAVIGVGRFLSASTPGKHSFHMKVPKTSEKIEVPAGLRNCHDLLVRYTV